MASTLSTDGTRIHYDRGGRAGSGKNIILLHGAGSNSSTWKNTAKGLRCRWAAPDMRGHGRTQTIPNTHKSVQDILAVADAEGMTKFSVAGICAGGTIALAVARHAPRRVEHVIIVSPFDWSLVRGASLLYAICQCTRALCTLLPWRKNLRRVDYSNGKRLPFFLTPLNDLRGVHARYYGHGTVLALRTPSTFEDIKAPIIIVSGKHDVFLRTDVLRRRISAVRNARHIELDANHHLLCWRAQTISSIINGALGTK